MAKNIKEKELEKVEGGCKPSREQLHYRCKDCKEDFWAAKPKKCPYCYSKNFERI